MPNFPGTQIIGSLEKHIPGASFVRSRLDFDRLTATATTAVSAAAPSSTGT